MAKQRQLIFTIGGANACVDRLIGLIEEAGEAAFENETMRHGKPMTMYSENLPMPKQLRSAST